LGVRLTYREVEKEPLQVMVPPIVALRVRELAARHRKSLAAITTELLCVALGLNARKFGLEPVCERGGRAEKTPA